MMSTNLRPAPGLLVALAFAIAFPRDAHAQGAPAVPDTNSAYKFILDYDVPDSPAFVALDVSPEKVLTGSAAKPVVVNLLNQFATGGKLGAGLALDFSPYFLAGGRFQSISEYRRNPIKRILANTTLSIASVQDPQDSAAMRFGAGVRVTLFDDHDPLQSDKLVAAVEQVLSGGPLTPARTQGIQQSVAVPTLAEAYAKAVEDVRNMPGRALAVGWGVAGTLRGSVVSQDSVTRTRHRLWAGYRQTFTGGWEMLGALLVGGSGGTDHDYRVGGALRTNTPGFRLTGEVVYESATGDFHPGGVAEFKVLPQINVVASLRSEPDELGADASKLRFRTALRWNMSQSGGGK